MTSTAIAPGPGHNQPIPLEAINDRVSALVVAANKWIKDVPEIKDKPLADKCDGFLGQVQAARKEAEAQRETELRPHLDAEKSIRTAYKSPLDLLDAIKFRLNALLMPWLSAERARLAAEKQRLADEAAKRVREAAEAARKAAAPSADPIRAAVAAQAADDAAAAAVKARDAAPERPQAKSEFSARARTLREHWSAEVEDIDLAFAWYKTNPKVREVLTELASADARRADRPAAIPGCRMIRTESLG